MKNKIFWIIENNFIFYSAGQVFPTDELRRHVNYLLFIHVMNKIARKVKKVWAEVGWVMASCAKQLIKFGSALEKVLTENSKGGQDERRS